MEPTTADALADRLADVERRLATLEWQDNVLADALLPVVMSPLLGTSIWRRLDQLLIAVKAWMDARASLGPERKDGPRG